MKVVTFTDLRLSLKKWIDFVVNDLNKLLIKKNKDLVLISLEINNSLKETSLNF